MNKSMTYAWRPGCRMKGDAQRVGNALSEIDRKFGCLTPSSVVRTAQSTRSDLHRYFEWDDEVAGSKYREEQARHLIRSIRVISDSEATPSLPAFVHVAFAGDSMYQRPEVVLEDEDKWSSVIREAAIDLRAIERRLEELMWLENEVRGRTASGIKTYVERAAARAERALKQ